MSQRDELIAALETSDEVTIRRLEWAPVLEAASTWWAPKQRCTFAEFVPYAKLLGDYDPADVLEALAELAGEWRPHPAAVRGALNGKRNAEKRPDVGRSTDRSRSPEALAAVRAALAVGERACECGAPSARKWIADAHAVWRCPNCQGVEPGQAFAAEDHTLTHPEQEEAAA